MLGHLEQSVGRLIQEPEVLVRYPVQPHSFVSLIQEGQLLVTGKSMCTKYWLSTEEVQACPRKCV